MNRLLILACSATKRPTPELLPAIERYNGPIYQTLRAARAEGLELPTTVILSAMFGVITSNLLIPNYDLELTEKRIRQLHQGGRIFPVLSRLAWQHRPEEVLVVGGALYVQALRDDSSRPDRGTFGWAAGARVVVAHGGIGEKRRQLREWLAGAGREVA